MVNVLVVCKLQVGGWVYILEVRTLMLRMVFVFVVCEILQGEWAYFRVRTLIGCEKHVLETTALLWVVWLYVCFVLFCLLDWGVRGDFFCKKCPRDCGFYYKSPKQGLNLSRS